MLTLIFWVGSCVGWCGVGGGRKWRRLVEGREREEEKDEQENI